MKHNFDYITKSFCLAAVLFNSLSYAKNDPFTLAFDCNKQTKFCAYGRLPPKLNAWLLDSDGSCKLIAGDQFLFLGSLDENDTSYEARDNTVSDTNSKTDGKIDSNNDFEDSNSFDATRLIEKTKCPLTESPAPLYLLKDFKSSAFFQPRIIHDEKSKQKFSQLIKTEKAIKPRALRFQN